MDKQPSRKHLTIVHKCLPTWIFTKNQQYSNRSRSLLWFTRYVNPSFVWLYYYVHVVLMLKSGGVNRHNFGRGLSIGEFFLIVHKCLLPLPTLFYFFCSGSLQSCKQWWKCNYIWLESDLQIRTLTDEGCVWVWALCFLLPCSKLIWSFPNVCDFLI
jgi:hypothetical protein